jgi:hypothetical protein
LDSPNTIQYKNFYSIYLPGKELTKLIEFLSTRKEKGAVEIDGKKCAVSVKYVFPAEPVWTNAFNQEE